MTGAEFVVANAPHTDQRTPLRWVLSHVRRHAWLVPIVLVGAFGNAALAGVVPVLIGRAFDALQGPVPDTAAVARIALWVALSQAVRAVLQLGRNFGSELIGQRLERDARDELYASLLGKSMAFHSSQPVGDTMARATNDVREVNLMLNPGVNLVVGSANFLVIPLLYAPRYHPQLLAAPLAFIVLYFWALRRYLRTLDPITAEARATFGDLNACLAEAIDGIEVVKSAAQEAAEAGRFRRLAEAYRAAFVAQGHEEARFLPLLLLGLTTGFGFVHALTLHQHGLLSVGDVVGYMSLLGMFGFPTFMSLFAYSQVSSGLASAGRILEIIRSPTELDENPGGHRGVVTGHIEFRDVGFGYSSGAGVLRHVSFAVEPGQTLALVGQTGSGKTTLARMVNRTHDPTSGAVLVDGVDVREWSLQELRRQIAIIEQDVFLLSRSIAENIAFGRPEATPDQIERAAREAQIHDFVSELPDGYATVVGERGVTLSGGQRQRLAIARALLTEPRILILDDATSAIDSATEDQIQRAMARAARGRTTVLITHRLSQIRWADIIVVLMGGEAVAVGAHGELMAACEPYRRLFDEGTRRDRGAA